MRHLLKLHASPNDDAAAHWRDEIDVFLRDAADSFAPSMRQRIDTADIWRWAATRSANPGLPTVCPWTIETLLDGDIEILLSALTGPDTAARRTKS